MLDLGVKRVDSSNQELMVNEKDVFSTLPLLVSYHTINYLAIRDKFQSWIKVINNRTMPGFYDCVNRIYIVKRL